MHLFANQEKKKESSRILGGHYFKAKRKESSGGKEVALEFFQSLQLNYESVKFSKYWSFFT